MVDGNDERLVLGRLSLSVATCVASRPYPANDLDGQMGRVPTASLGLDLRIEFFAGGHRAVAGDFAQRLALLRNRLRVAFRRELFDFFFVPGCFAQAGKPGARAVARLYYAGGRAFERVSIAPRRDPGVYPLFGAPVVRPANESDDSNSAARVGGFDFVRHSRNEAALRC
jgi:hypothetical protein